ncbi:MULTISPECIES: DUF4895 domain-containing protein [unclassified Thermosipho (in: thermotogales)]|uniref:DUF4895 domain-containing protein n=1 Tax=unclassified Thermosipho (in: thermotogales) TaxID=2676525 RepID=UPI0009852409|nr:MULTISPECIES: DUF4895 domain-containing protein [unclassified Thermosipho (in: thermotogales)]MBT1247256.1 hypothetical protein [Thermosipho sp. 1244]OOC47174.1 hypothetical protein XO09_02545 [Thermosipho sp. 1223]
MVYFGPEKLRPLMNEVFSLLEEDKNVLIDFLYKFEDVLDVFHKHLILVTVGSNGIFFLNAGYNPDGKFFFGVSLSNPFLRTPSLYKMEYFNEDFENLYINSFSTRKIPFMTTGILKFPIMTHFLALGGEKSLISKELFSEEVSGKSWLNFSKKVDDKTYDELLTLNGKKYHFLKTFLTDDGVYFIGVGEGEHRNLYAEFFSFLRNKYKFQPGKYFPISDMKDKVIGMFKVDLEDLKEKWKYVESFVEDFEKFRGFIKDLGG